MVIRRAAAYGMCFGVRDAISLALEEVAREPQLTVLGDLVHNPVVLERLAARGVRRGPSPDAGAPPDAADRVMVTAHGAAERDVARLRARGLHVLDATCPLVRHVHRCLARLVRDGYCPVIIGRRDHVEVRGLLRDLEDAVVVQDTADVALLAGRPRLGVVSQTTEPPARVQSLVAAIRAAYPQAEVRFFDTVCQPTRDRQAAAEALGRECSVVIVVGGRDSNNTRHLAQTCRAGGARVYHVEKAEDLHPGWVAGADVVGLTAGTSTPDDVVEEVHSALLRLAAVPLSLAA